MMIKLAPMSNRGITSNSSLLLLQSSMAKYDTFIVKRKAAVKIRNAHKKSRIKLISWKLPFLLKSEYAVDYERAMDETQNEKDDKYPKAEELEGGLLRLGI